MYNLPPAGTPFTSKPVYHKKLYILHAKLNFVDFPKTPSWISKFIFQKNTYLPHSDCNPKNFPYSNFSMPNAHFTLGGGYSYHTMSSCFASMQLQV